MQKGKQRLLSAPWPHLCIAYSAYVAIRQREERHAPPAVGEIVFPEDRLACMKKQHPATT